MTMKTTFFMNRFSSLLHCTSLLLVLAGLVSPAVAQPQPGPCGFVEFGGLGVSAPSTVSAGVPFNITVTAGPDSQSGGLWLDYYSTDQDAILPAMQATSFPDDAQTTIQVVVQTPGMQAICPLDADGVSGSVSINVLATSHVTASESSVNFGSLAIGTPSTPQAVSFSIASPGNTVGSIGVMTQGAASMDFTEATGSTCTATTYTSATNCTVNVIFTPTSAGLRVGAVVLFSEAGNKGMQLASVPIYGVGTGPQIAYGPGTWTDPSPVVNGTALNYPLGVAVDGLGDLFIADQFRVVKVPAGGGAASAISPAVGGYGLNLSWGVAVDGAGDVLVTNSYWYVPQGQYAEVGSEVMVAPSGGGYAKAIDAGFYYPTDAAVDGAGDVFVADNYNSRVVEVPAGGGAPITIDPTVNSLGLNGPYGVALDSAGDLFITDTSNNRVVEVPAGGGPSTALAPTVDGLALNGPVGIAVDAAGDLFIADANNNRVVEIPAGGGSAIAVAPVVNGLGLNSPQGIAVDGAGDLFITDSNNNRVLKWQRSEPPMVVFPTPTLLGSIDTTDGTRTSQIFNIGNEPLDFTAVSYPADFLQESGDANACINSTSLSAGQECDLPISFTPENIGPTLHEDVTITDNALSEAGAQQSIGVTGRAQAVPATLSLPTPGSVLKGPEVTFSWSAAAGASGYSLWLGSSGVGSRNLYDSGEHASTSATVKGLSTNGETIYARINTIFNGKALYIDTTYTEVAAAVLTSPAAGSLLAGPTVTFSWTAVTGASGYSLWLGSTGVGSHNLYDSGEHAGTSATVKGLPTNGETIYARINTIFNGFSRHVDYTYAAH